MFRSLLLSAVVLASGAFASNEARAINPAKYCSTVKSVVTAARQQASATAYCKAYMCTSTTTTVVFTTTTSLSVTTSTATVTPKACGPPNFGNLRKRREAKKRDYGADLEPRNTSPKKPSCLSKYSPGAPLSSACSCLGVTKGVTTATSTSTVKTTSTSTSTTTVTSGTPPTPASYYIVASGAPANGQYASVQSDGTVNFSANGPADVFYDVSYNDNPGYLGTTQFGDLAGRIPGIGNGATPGPVSFVDGFGNLVKRYPNPREDGTCPTEFYQAELSHTSSVCGSNNKWNLGDGTCDGGSQVQLYIVAT